MGFQYVCLKIDCAAAKAALLKSVTIKLSKVYFLLMLVQIGVEGSVAKEILGLL
jgi:hypothetical protein